MINIVLILCFLFFLQILECPFDFSCTIKWQKQLRLPLCENLVAWVLFCRLNVARQENQILFLVLTSFKFVTLIHINALQMDFEWVEQISVFLYFGQTKHLSDNMTLYLLLLISTDIHTVLVFIRLCMTYLFLLSKLEKVSCTVLGKLLVLQHFQHL